MDYETISCEIRDRVAHIRFCRPEVHNAFNDTVIYEMTDLFSELDRDAMLRVVVLTGEGKSFCSGADLNWMKRVITQSFEENLKESTALANLFARIYHFRRPVIGRINGAAIGGGVGFVAVCDVAIAAESAKFSFSEVKIGLVPACIGPYVVKKVGEGKAREFFITGERMNGLKAFEAGLVNRCVPDDQLDDAINDLLAMIKSSGPEAIAVAKDLVSSVPNMSEDEYKRFTAEMIARLRISEEGQEGMSAFLQKRKPKWIND
ncbi:MAG: enoyl-CoA hydratase/isomerase family protein [Candidatus Zixiibacteriota bacterium]|nr:MAG: enoyl-CoA hydratase/isomerase family protein [candidate division Zixibacteria bacterium]